MRKFTPLLLFTLAILLSVVKIAKAEEVIVAPNNTRIVYTGRFTKDYRFGWTGCSISLRFTGSTIAAKLNLIYGSSAAMQVIVDGVPTRPLFLDKKNTTYTLASNLSPGAHTVEVFKRTEAENYGEIQFKGFILPSGAKLKKLAPEKRKILLLGDSISCGFKNETRSASVNDGLKTENGYMSYAAIAARRVHAQIMMICWSGRGLYRNYYFDHDQEGTIPKLFARTLPLDPQPEWDQKEYIPQLIVIDLGTNDLDTDKGKKSPLVKEMFLTTYDQLIDRLHSLFPRAQMIASIGPIYDHPIDQWLQELPVKYDFVHVLVYPDKDPLEDVGAGTLHPSILGDIKMADELMPLIQTTMHWKPLPY